MQFSTGILCITSTEKYVLKTCSSAENLQRAVHLLRFHSLSGGLHLCLFVLLNLCSN